MAYPSESVFKVHNPIIASSYPIAFRKRAGLSFHLGKPRLPSVEYYPNNIGNLPIGTARSYAFPDLRPRRAGNPGPNTGHSSTSVGLELFPRMVMRMIGAEFTLCVSCDLGEVSVTPDDLVIELRRMKQVRNAIGDLFEK